MAAIIMEVGTWIKVPSTLITAATFTLPRGALDAEGVQRQGGDVH